MKATPAETLPVIRLARAEDLAAINAIYNHYVQHSTCTYQEQPESIEGRREWFARHGAAHPVTVAELNGRIVGWAALSAYHARSAYRHTVENSVYVDQGIHGRGIDLVAGPYRARQNLGVPCDHRSDRRQPDRQSRPARQVRF